MQSTESLLSPDFHSITFKTIVCLNLFKNFLLDNHIFNDAKWRTNWCGRLLPTATVEALAVFLGRFFALALPGAGSYGVGGGKCARFAL
jgi:hypothetical protein